MRRCVILAEGGFGPQTSKTANAVLRFAPTTVVAVIDSLHAGRTAQDVLGYGGRVPVLSSLEEVMALGPRDLLIGISPPGGQLPKSYRPFVLQALGQGLDVYSGLHVRLADDPAFAAAAMDSGVLIHDLRRPPDDLGLAAGRVRDVGATVVLTVGTDSNIGKMTTLLQVRPAVRALGHRVAFAATGQTGILLEGSGIAVDAVVADFIAGAAERVTLDAARDADIVLVEGQGSLIHPAYSGVALGLLHGAMPHAMIMCAQPTRTTINRHPWVSIPPLSEVIRLTEAMTDTFRPAPVIAIALNTFDLSDGEAREAVRRVQNETGLLTTDPVRFGPGAIADAIDTFHRERLSGAAR
ncbi:MAG: DUF1611 domain-containing protein [Gemmatimonadaceae bacterium]|nr:DUF1611 domain-containing protein [Gemmatimonadaceae bacterium]